MVSYMGIYSTKKRQASACLKIVITLESDLLSASRYAFLCAFGQVFHVKQQINSLLCDRL